MWIEMSGALWYVHINLSNFNSSPGRAAIYIFWNLNKNSILTRQPNANAQRTNSFHHGGSPFRINVQESSFMNFGSEPQRRAFWPLIFACKTKEKNMHYLWVLTYFQAVFYSLISNEYSINLVIFLTKKFPPSEIQLFSFQKKQYETNEKKVYF